MTMNDSDVQLVLDNMETATILLNSDLRMVHMNVAAEALIERSFKRIKGEPLEDHLLIGDLSTALKTANLERNRIIRRETEIELPSGKSLVINLSLTPIHDDSLLLELRQIDRHLDISQSEQLQMENQATKKLLRGLAHEIKNPLGGIRGAAQLLAQQYPDNGVGEFTHVIIKEADRLRTLIDRMVGPQTVTTPALTNIHEAVEHVFRLTTAEVPESIQLTRDYDPSIPEIMVDRDQLIQAILNITRNAIEAFENKRGQIVFKTRVLRHYNLGSTRHPLLAQISIIDNGPGIPKDLQSEVFFPMVTGKATGTGLGLSITQSIIQHNNGLVKFSSRPGRTCFEILLPISEANS